MKSSILYTAFVSFGPALSFTPTTRALQKRESGEFSCYTATNIWDFSALCPNINYPIHNDMGLSVMGQFYFALASTTVPDDTVYEAQENIICQVQGETGNITATVGAGIGNDLVNAGASVTFTLAAPNFGGGSICMFTQGTDDDYRNVTDSITLGQARDLLYTMLTAPAVDCKTCGRIPIRYLDNVTDGTDQGGILKIDRIDANNCIGKCVGPASFNTDEVSSSAAPRVEPYGLSSTLGNFALVAMVGWLVVAGLE